MSINEPKPIPDNLIVLCEYFPEVVREILEKEVSITDLTTIVIYGNQEQKKIALEKLKKTTGTLKKWIDVYKNNKNSTILELATKKINDYVSNETHLKELIRLYHMLDGIRIVREKIWKKIKSGPFPLEEIIDAIFHENKTTSPLKKYLNIQITAHIKAISDEKTLKKLQVVNNNHFIKKIISERLSEL